jgi:hypothetical protein
MIYPREQFAQIGNRPTHRELALIDKKKKKKIGMVHSKFLLGHHTQETDKATMDVEAQDEGKIAKIIVSHTRFFDV